MDRRNFLNPQQLAKAAGQFLGPVVEDALPATPAPPAPVENVALLRFGRRAMAAQFEVLLPFDAPNALELAEAALDEVHRLEEQLTVFHEHSEVSRLNREAASRPVTVEDRLFGLLTLAARLTQATGGAYDVTTGALTKAWGFYRRQGRVPTPEERAGAMSRVGMGHVILDAERRSVRFRRAGLEINLGSIGKGYALDRAAELLRRATTSALLHGGQSSVLAVGEIPGDDRGWTVAIRHPFERDRSLCLVRLRDRGLATSGAVYQHLEYNGRKLGHILDPRTGWPAEGMASASVLAPTAAEADALSTAFFILGVDAARAYCAAHPEIAAVLLPEGADAKLTVINLAAHEVDCT